MAGSYLLGIDVGTSGCKSIIIDEAGTVVGSSLKEYPLSTPRPGWSEQNPGDWWEAVQAGVQEVLRSTGTAASELKGLGLSAQMHGLVALDKDFNVLRPSILWNDQRTARQCRRIHELAGGIEGLLKLTNNQMLPGYTGGKVLWVRENEPDIYEKIDLILNPKDYIRHLLTGEVATEVSDASGTGLFNVEKREWSDQLLGLLEISKDLLPKCYESSEVSGRISARASELTGLPEGLPVVGGGGDAVVQTTGMGLVKPGILGITIGTSGIIAMGLDRYYPNPGGHLQVFCNNSPDTWHVMGVSLCAGGAYRWYRDTFCESLKEQAAREGRDVYLLLEELASKSPAGSRGIVFLPYLIGERCPYPDPNLRAAFIGLGLDHGQADVTRSVMEGVVLNLRDSYELIRKMDSTVQEIRASGGGSLSPLWRQIQADVFQCPVTTLKGSGEGGAYGAALVAGVGAGIWSTIHEAVGVIQVESETLPDAANKQIYEDAYGIFHGLYSALKPAYDALAAVHHQ